MIAVERSVIVINDERRLPLDGLAVVVGFKDVVVAPSPEVKVIDCGRLEIGVLMTVSETFDGIRVDGNGEVEVIVMLVNVVLAIVSVGDTVVVETIVVDTGGFGEDFVTVDKGFVCVKELGAVVVKPEYVVVELLVVESGSTGTLDVDVVKVVLFSEVDDVT